MRLYNLSLFLNKEEFKSLRSACNEYEIFAEDFDLYEDGSAHRCFQMMVSDFPIVILPSNDFHKHLDYEIGFTFPGDDSDWSGLLGQLKREKIAYKIDSNDDGDFMVLEDTHGPFFFINYGEYPSWENSIKIEAAVSEEDFDIQAKLLKILGKEFSDTIQLESGSEYRFKSIEFSTSVLQFRADENEILLKAT